jgi:ubiquinone biosynthesis protein
MTVLVPPLILVFTALTVLVFAFGARRLLGLRFSFLRTLIAGALAFLIASPIITAISGSVVAKRTSVLPELWFVILGVTIALVVGMVFLVVAEALVPSGRCRDWSTCCAGCAGGWAGRGATGRSAGSWCGAA